MRSDKTTPILTNHSSRRLVLLLVLLPSLFLNSGCWNKVEVINTVETEGIVFDLENGQPSMSIQLAQPTSNASGSPSNEPLAITQTGRSFTECARNVMLSLPRLPVWSHAGVIVLGESLAHEDLAQVSDFIARNRHVRKSALLFISKGISGKECLEAELPAESFSLPGLEKLVRLQEDQLGIYIPVLTDNFLEKLATPGVQPTAPQVTAYEAEGQKVLRLDGTAVFKGRRQVGSLDETESRGFRFLSPKMITGGLLVVNVPGQNEMGRDNLIVLELTRSKADIVPQIEGPRVKSFQISIKAEGNFYEQNFAEEIFTLEGIPILEELTNQEIKRQVAAAVTKAQTLQSDIFGWGNMIYRQEPALWQHLEGDWPMIFAGMETDITVDFSLRRTYLLDHSFNFKE